MARIKSGVESRQSHAAVPAVPKRIVDQVGVPVRGERDRKGRPVDAKEYRPRKENIGDADVTAAMSWAKGQLAGHIPQEIRPPGGEMAGWRPVLRWKK
jgi:hypothetical protein